jgi:hypothetical protein
MAILAEQHTPCKPDLLAGALPAHLAPRLAAEGIASLADWRRLSRRKKRSIWGVTAAHVGLLDTLSRSVP